MPPRPPANPNQTKPALTRPLAPPPPSPLHEEDIGELSPYRVYTNTSASGSGVPSSAGSTASLSSAASGETAGSDADTDTAGGARWKGGGAKAGGEGRGYGLGLGYGYDVFGEEEGEEEEGREAVVQGEGGEGATPRRTTFARSALAVANSNGKAAQRADIEAAAEAHPSSTQDTNPSPRKMQAEIRALAVDPAAVKKMRRWILGIAVVEFDLDAGPVVDGIYPPLALLPAEAENIAFCALPDSLQFDTGSQTHSFRVRAQQQEISVSVRQNQNGEADIAKGKGKDLEDVDADAPTTLDGFIYGFSHFVQRRDAASKRGYHQRAVVILTQHAYPALFSALAALFGPLFELHGTPMLEAACHNIATWPPPHPGTTRELGFLGTVLPVELPHSADAQQVAETSSFGERYDVGVHILATLPPFHPAPLHLFAASLPHLWSIWECLVLSEPILVFGPSPALTSQAVWWLRDLVRPIPLARDIRPYFTMQDADSRALVNRLPPKAGVLLGVTNPFFERSCAHWPHVLSLGGVGKSASSPKHRSPTLGAPAGPAPGWTTKTHRRYISKDRALLKRLEGVLMGKGGAGGGGDERACIEASLALRKHFCTRSAQLIMPLARYLNTLIPSPEEVHGHRAAQAQVQRNTVGARGVGARVTGGGSGSGGLRHLGSTVSLPVQASSPSPSLSQANSTANSPVPSFRSVGAGPTTLSSSSSSSSSNYAHKNGNGTHSSPSLALHAHPSTTAPTPSTSTSTSTSLAPAAPNTPKAQGQANPLLRLKPFNSAAFLASLKTYGAGSGNGSLLPFKSASKRTEFYERWLKSPAFATWLAQQEQIVLSVLNEPSLPQNQQRQ